MLSRIQPMLLTRIVKPFDDPDYIFELKHDGFRTTQRLLLQLSSLVPIDDVDELPGIFVELEFELPLFVNDQLGGWVENTATLLVVSIINFDLAGGQIVGDALGLAIHFTESKQTVGDEANLATCRSRNQANETEVVAKRAGDGNAADGLHLGEGIYQTLTLPLLEGINEDLSVLLG